MNALGAAITLILSLLIFTGNRKRAALSILLGICYLTQGQELDLIAFHFTSVRLLLLFGLIRLNLKGEFGVWKIQRVDKWLLLYCSLLFFVSVLRVGTLEEVIYQMGIFYNVSMSYFVFRGLITNYEEFTQFFKSAGFVIVPLSVAMLIEARTGSSVFSVFGGISEASVIRDDKVRCNGPFRQAITAGAFGASFVVLNFGCIALYRKMKLEYVVGLVAGAIVLITAHSSGPILGALIGVFSIVLWRFRKHMRVFRWALVVGLLALAAVMKDPVWFIIARLSDIFGGGGYHRSYLIDRFINDFHKWWLLGSDDTASWFPYQIFGKADITNQFVSDGLNGGLLGLAISIGLVVLIYRLFGFLLDSSDKIGGGDARTRYFWILASVFTANIAILFSVTYFDQSHVFWYGFLAGLVGLGEEASKGIGSSTTTNDID